MLMYQCPAFLSNDYSDGMTLVRVRQWIIKSPMGVGAFSVVASTGWQDLNNWDPDRPIYLPIGTSMERCWLGFRCPLLILSHCELSRATPVVGRTINRLNLPWTASGTSEVYPDLKRIGFSSTKTLKFSNGKIDYVFLHTWFLRPENLYPFRFLYSIIHICGFICSVVRGLTCIINISALLLDSKFLVKLN